MFAKKKAADKTNSSPATASVFAQFVGNFVEEDPPAPVGFSLFLFFNLHPDEPLVL